MSHKYTIVLLNEKNACKIQDYNYDLLFFLNLNMFTVYNFKHVNTNKIICGKTSEIWPENEHYINFFKKINIVHANTKNLCNQVKLYNTGTAFYVPNGIDRHKFYKTREVGCSDKLRISMIASEFRAYTLKGLTHYLRILKYLKDNFQLMFSIYLLIHLMQMTNLFLT